MVPTSSFFATRLLCAITAALVFVAAPAAAKDFCIDRADTAANPDFILENFKIPKAGKCKPLLGLATPIVRSVISGAACGSSDGTHVSFALTIGFMPGPLEASIPSTGNTVPFNVLLRTADLTGLAFSRVGSTADGGAASGAECKNETIP